MLSLTIDTYPDVVTICTSQYGTYVKVGSHSFAWSMILVGALLLTLQYRTTSDLESRQQN